MLYLGPAAVETLLAIHPEEAVIDPAASVFGLSTSLDLPDGQGGDEDGGTGRGVQRPLAQGRYGPGPERRRADLAELMTASRWDNTTMPTRHTEAPVAGTGAVAQYCRGDLRK